MMNAGTAEFENLQTDIGVLTALISQIGRAHV